jgi:hypothetical protein
MENNANPAADGYYAQDDMSSDEINLDFLNDEKDEK